MKYKTGKHPVDKEKLKGSLKFGKYIKDPALPVAPVVFDSLSNVVSFLGLPAVATPIQTTNVSTLLPLDHNDTFGDCVMCMWAHGVTMYNGLVGKKVVPDPDAVKAAYFMLTKGEDSGLNIQSTLEYAAKKSLLGETPGIPLYINPTNLAHVRLALYLTGYVHTGIMCQDNFADQFEAHEPWDASGNDEGGHGIGLLASDEKYFYVATWGGIAAVTHDCWAQKVDECWVVLPAEATNPHFCPGFDYTTLKTDLVAISDNF